MYTIKKLAKLSCVSTRTLRYYDEIDLLKPASLNESGYRYYDENSVDLLQQILYYKYLGVSLRDIKQIIYDETFDKMHALYEHREKLIEESNRIQILIQTLNKTIISNEGMGVMADQEKFEGFKKKLISENQEKYGKESVEKYGAHVKESEEKIMKMNEATYNNLETLSKDMHQLFVNAYKKGDPTSKEAQKACEMHETWIKGYWTTYSKEAHMGLAEMYVEDERFKKYYDSFAENLAFFLRDAMKVYLGVS